MIPKEAIEKAIEGGWNTYIANGWSPLEWCGAPRFSGDELYFIALDPSFWQSLGKALGWKGKAYFRSKGYECEPWQFFQLSFVEASWGGADEVADFWRELLAK